MCFETTYDVTSGPKPNEDFFIFVISKCMYDSRLFKTGEPLLVIADIYFKQIGTLLQNIPLQQGVSSSDNFKIYHHKRNRAFSGIFWMCAVYVQVVLVYPVSSKCTGNSK